MESQPSEGRLIPVPRTGPVGQVGEERGDRVEQAEASLLWIERR